LIKASRTGNNADSVFPVAVGAISNTFFPAIIGGIALIWGSVGAKKPFSWMAFWIGVENEENTVVGGISIFAILLYCYLS
jgi:hypothetical protein